MSRRWVTSSTWTDPLVVIDAADDAIRRPSSTVTAGQGAEQEPADPMRALGERAITELEDGCGGSFQDSLVDGSSGRPEEFDSVGLLLLSYPMPGGAEGRVAAAPR